MKKFFALVFVIGCLQMQAQFVNQVTKLGSFTKNQVDSILQLQGIPSGVFQGTYSVDLYRMIYNTVDWDSNAITASGLFALPKNAPCKVGMLSYQHGTITQKSDGMSYLAGEWFISLAAASKGYVIAMPDYLGLGYGPGLHPYQHAHTEATAVIDMIRAVKEVTDSLGAPVNDQLFLFGYSQGGHATMAAHQLIQQQLDNVMHVTASAPMSGAYDMSGVMADVMTSNNPYPAPYYLPYLMFGYNEVYHLFANDSDIFVHPYDTILRPLFDGLHGGGSIDNVMPNVPKLIMQPAQLDSFINDSVNNFFRVKLRENNTYNWTPTSPVRMYYCQGDHYVPYQNAMVAYQHFSQNNGAIGIDTVDASFTLEHQACAQLALPAGLFWFDSLAYKPLASGGVTVVNNTHGASPNGSATVLPTQGNPGYKYLWSNGDTTATITSLLGGTYYVTVTDRNLCSYTDSAVVLAILNGIEEQVLTNVRIFPNPAKGMVTIENTDPNDNIKQTDVFDMNGNLIKTYPIKQGNNTQLWFDNAAQGVYYIRLKSESGKEVRKKITIM